MITVYMPRISKGQSAKASDQCQSYGLSVPRLRSVVSLNLNSLHLQAAASSEQTPNTQTTVGEKYKPPTLADFSPTLADFSPTLSLLRQISLLHWRISLLHWRISLLRWRISLLRWQISLLAGGFLSDTAHSSPPKAKFLFSAKIVHFNAGGFLSDTAHSSPIR